MKINYPIIEFPLTDDSQLSVIMIIYFMLSLILDSVVSKELCMIFYTRTQPLVVPIGYGVP